MTTPTVTPVVEYSVVVPVFQGQDTLRLLVDELQKFFVGAGYTYELIFVHDGGQAAAWNRIVQLRQELGPGTVKAIRLSRNFGQHNALLCGFSYASGRFIITLDEDLQHAPADISLLIQRQAEGDFDVVYGCYSEPQHAGWRNVTSGLLRRMLRLGIPDLHPDYSAFRLLKTTVARHCLGMQNSYTFLDGYLTWVTSSISSVPVTHHPRVIGSSSYTVGRLVRHSVNIFITFSDVPVRLLTYTSLVLFSCTTGYSLYILLRKLIYNDLLPGFASLIIAIGFGTGLLLLGMGILGEYIHRINQKITKRPDFVVRETYTD
ncbi:glycosyltransferase family 2 protein [Hymenobacter tibetensis]|uniref:Glycosyltransferase family 2 protein n=1 Tax=Hymenobacter tibetensis TaxID=497967 RepID=A0ABY4D0E9_9BACT|nr:glycosyltransferase family 2 protein [Hymenobacter tibetensis]UOG76009.1 glycosyltransferase family 2 protein [Hymenobacter tibetensis]